MKEIAASMSVWSTSVDQTDSAHCVSTRPPKVAADMEYSASSALALLGGQHIGALATEECNLSGC